MTDWAARDAIEYPLIDGGHAWIRDANGLVDNFQLEYEHHNGPRCARCGESFCEHCEPQRITEECPDHGTELPGMELA